MGQRGSAAYASTINRTPDSSSEPEAWSLISRGYQMASIKKITLKTRRIRSHGFQRFHRKERCLERDSITHTAAGWATELPANKPYCQWIEDRADWYPWANDAWRYQSTFSAHWAHSRHRGRFSAMPNDAAVGLLYLFTLLSIYFRIKRKLLTKRKISTTKRILTKKLTKIH